MSNELLPCPWCGGTMNGEPSVSEGSTFRWLKVDGCCTDGPEVRVHTLEKDREAALDDARIRAIAAWNTRAPIANTREGEAKDAARYRWLRVRANQNVAYDRYGDGGHWSIGFFSEDNRLSFDETVDNAIKGQG
jgi:hypothetical protein